jgi:hypothetical protein
MPFIEKKQVFSIWIYQSISQEVAQGLEQNQTGKGGRALIFEKQSDMSKNKR